jgi:hypothetical protein
MNNLSPKNLLPKNSDTLTSKHPQPWIYKFVAGPPQTKRKQKTPHRENQIVVTKKLQARNFRRGLSES